MELAPANDRGFLKGSFKDHYGEQCSIQKSSLVHPDCIWLGCEHRARMHLTQQMVAYLIPLLQHFVDTGELPSQGDQCQS